MSPTTMTPRSTGAFVRSVAVVLFCALGWRHAQAFSVHRLGAGGIQRSHHHFLTTTTSAHRRSRRTCGPLFLGSSSPNESNAQLTKEEAPLTNYTPPKFEKEEDEVAFLARTLLTNFMFDSLPDATLQKLALAFEEVDAEKGTTLIRQGDTDIDFFYVLRSGECSVAIDGKRLPDPYGTMTTGTIFGELGMLYDNPRAATVSATKDCKLYRLDRQAFRHFLDEEQDTDKEELKEELKKIDVAIDKIAGVKAKYSGGEIVRQFRPGRFWLWRQWSGTVLQHAYKTSLFNMAVTAFISILIRRRADCHWGWFTAPDQSHPVISRMATFGKGWHYIMGLTTFILTFFLSQSYGLWREIYTKGRAIQGRLNDVGIILATSADRDEDGQYTKAAEGVMDGVARAARLFHTFTWASFKKSLGVLRTPRGMSRMLSRGLMTRSEYAALQGADARRAGAQNACLEWMLVRAMRGLHKGGGISGGEAAEHVLLGKMCTLRGTAAGIGDTLAGRMPLAYAHMVQILVDTFLATAPVALYAEMGVWSVFSVGVLTLFYSGLLTLAKIFLDPLGNEGCFHESVNCDIGVLIRESNAGSTRWKEGISTMPA